MNKEQLEKMFDEKFFKQYSWIDTIFWETWLAYDIKEYIFKTIMPEVLNSVTDKCSSYDLDYIKFQAKELYDINL
jgi:hypothetical protein